MNDRNINNRSDWFKDKTAQFINDPDSNQPYDTNGEHTERFRYNTAYRQKKKRNTHTGGRNGKNIDKFLYHSIFKSFSNPPGRHQEDNEDKNNFQIYVQAIAHHLSNRTFNLSAYCYFNLIVSIESAVTNIYL